MPKFIVYIQRQRPEYTTIEIEAEDEEDAQDVAFDEACKADLIFEPSDTAEDWEISEIEPQPDDDEPETA